MAKKYKIKVKIAGKEYAFNIDYKDEHIFRKAAKLVDTKYAEYVKVVGLDPKDCLALIATESYVKYFREVDDQEKILLNQKLEEISDLMNSKDEEIY